MKPLIYHNPECGTSRNTLAMIEASGETPDIVEYLKTPPTRARLVARRQIATAGRRSTCRRRRASS